MNTPTQIKYVDLSNTKRGDIESTQFFSDADAPSRAQRVIRRGDTIIGTVRPSNGSYAYVGIDGMTASTGFAVLRPKDSNCRELVYLAATSKENIERLSHLADGGAYPAVRPEVVAATQIFYPCQKIIKAFSEALKPCFSRIESAKAEKKLLSTIRNTLLPKLISGEIRIKEAEKIVREAA